MRAERALTLAPFLASLLVSLPIPAGPAQAAEPPAAHSADASRAALAAELSAVAQRIEALKREVAAGRSSGGELERLLARAQELAALLEAASRGATPTPRESGPDPQELRERADALRDRADRLTVALALLDGRLAEVQRRAELAERLDEVADAGELFSDTAPRRARAPSAGSGVQVPGQVSPPDSAGPAVASPAPGGGVSAPERRGSGASSAGDESPAALRRRRSELARELSTLRAQAASLDAEARAAEATR